MIPHFTASLTGPFRELEARILDEYITVELERTAPPE
jgi:hypothetical protein